MDSDNGVAVIFFLMLLHAKRCHGKFFLYFLFLQPVNKENCMYDVGKAYSLSTLSSSSLYY